jgi:hypothetical protein
VPSNAKKKGLATDQRGIIVVDMACLLLYQRITSETKSSADGIGVHKAISAVLYTCSIRPDCHCSRVRDGKSLLSGQSVYLVAPSPFTCGPRRIGQVLLIGDPFVVRLARIGLAQEQDLLIGGVGHLYVLVRVRFLLTTVVEGLFLSVFRPLPASLGAVDDDDPGPFRNERLTMSEERVTVYVLKPKDRSTLQLQWVDPDTGARRTKSAETDDPDKAEQARADLEYHLNHGLYQEMSKLDWHRFRELFEAEYVVGLRRKTRLKYTTVLDVFEQIINPAKLRVVNERTLSLFVKGMRERKTRKRTVGLAPMTIRNYLVALKTALG